MESILQLRSHGASGSSPLSTLENFSSPHQAWAAELESRITNFSSRFYNRASSIGILDTTNGTLATTDPDNPTRTGSFRDDYLLTGVSAGQSVQLNMNAAFDTYLQVVNAATGEVVAFNDDFNGLNSQLTFTAGAGINYIVRATSFSSGATGTYSLISDNGQLTSATPITSTQTFNGTLDSTDPANSLRPGSVFDGYLLTNLTAGQQARVNLDSTAFDSYLQVVNATTGEVVAFNDDSNGTVNSQLSFTAAAGVNYIARATSFSSGATGAYTLTTLLTGETVNGTLTSTDPDNPTRTGSFRDDYLLTGVTAGQSVQLNLNAAFDTYLQVVNAATGEVVAFNDDSNGATNSQLTFTTQAGVDYIARATSYSSGATGTYSLISNNGQLTSATPISGSQTFNGTLDSTDPANSLRNGSYYDGYLLTNLTPGQAVQVNLNAGFDAYLQVVNAATGAIVAFNDDSNSTLNSQLAFSVESGIDYIIRATSYSSGATGNYTLTTQAFTLPDGYNANSGYGLVNAAAAVAEALGQSPFPNVPNLGGDNWGRDMINAPEVWAQGNTGRNVIVAVIDTGVDYNHPDLVDNIWVNSREVAGDGIDNDSNGFIDDLRGWDFVDSDNNPMDLNRHGTHVAGIIAAENNGVNNGVNLIGVAPDATIMPVRVLDANGSGSWSSVAAGIRYATNNGADVINLSLGGGASSDIESAVQYAAEHGVVVVMAAGNESSGQSGFPANLADRWGLSVGAVNNNNQMADFSNRAGLSPLDYVTAPGVSVLSTTPINSYASFSGTSMATPHVAGVAALILSANPNLTPAQVEQIITRTAGSAIITPTAEEGATTNDLRLRESEFVNDTFSIV